MKRILIVDDRPVNRQYLVTLLRYCGYETREAGDGAEALAVMNGWIPDLAIVDLAMPVMSGEALVQAMRGDTRLAWVHVLFYTATYREPDAREKAKLCGVDGVLTKPAAPEVVLEAVERAIGRADATSARLPDGPSIEDSLHSARAKLASVIEFSLDLGEERDPSRVLQKLTRAACNTTGAAAALVCVCQGDTPACAWKGESAGRLAEALRSSPPLQEAFLRSLERRHVISRFTHDADGIAEAIAAACGHDTYVIVPMMFSSGRMGCLVLLERAGGGAYDSEDHALALTLALHASMTYENLAAQEELRRKNERLRRLFDSRVVGIVDWNTDGRITGANDAFLAMIGGRLDDLVAGERRWIDMMSADSAPAIEAALQQIVRTGECIPFEAEWVRADGSRLPTLMGGASVGKESSEGIAFVVDISARKEAEAALREVNRTLERKVAERTIGLRAANHDLESFCYSISHDLRGPLRSIEGFSDLMLRDASPALEPKALDRLERIHRASRTMSEMIEALLEMASVTRGSFSFEGVDLSRLALDIAGELRDENPSRRVQFDVDPGLRVQGDRRILRIVLANLLGNAWKFTAKRPDAAVSFRRTHANGRTVFCVRDNGIGFDMQYAAGLFSPFHRLPSSAGFEGHGIGLATVQRLVQRHGGTVWGEGVPGEGSAFYFSISSESGETR